MAWNQYPNVAAPAVNTFNPYATTANPYAPNPLGYSQPTNYLAGIQPTSTTPVTAQNTASQPMSVMPVQQNGNPFVLVPDRGVIKDAQVERNQTVFFMNQNAPEFYAKSADNLGLCNTKYYRFFEFDPEAEAQAAAQAQAQAIQQQAMPQGDYITRDEVESLIADKIESIKAMLAPAPTPKATGAKAKAPKESDE